MPRAAAGALFVVVAHTAILGFLGRTPPGPLLSNLSMIAAGLLATLACWRAASRGAGFSRSVWRLLAIALGVWSAAQISWTVTENVLGASVPEPSLTHLLFRLCGAPLIVALLLDEEELVASPPDWARVLDFVQVGIVFLFFYFDIYFVPPAPGTSLASLEVAGFLDISDVENWLIAGAYVLRTVFARTPEARRVFGRISLYLVAYAIASTTYNYGYYLELARTGHWFDLPWTIALGVASAVAATWQPRAEVARSEPASAMRVVTVGWVSAMAPIAVVALALQVARYQLGLAFLAVLASVSVFGARMLIERYRQVRALDALRASVTDRLRVEAEREALIRELEARNAELERFCYTVSHDLKAPLVTIRGFLGLVEQAAERGDAATVRADMDRIYRASDRMERLLSELLDLSRIGRVAGPPESVEMDAVAREAVANVGQQLVVRGVAIEIAPELPTVRGDRLRLVEVVQNLVDNAGKFMGEQERPAVVIGSRGGGPPGQALLFVGDNGIGIAERFHEQVFRLFDKLDPASPGTGVGLALVKRIVEVHGGSVWVESRGAGQGTTFCFTLPLASSPDAADPGPAASGPAGPAGGALTPQPLYP